jgi:hypothetical protein
VLFFVLCPQEVEYERRVAGSLYSALESGGRFFKLERPVDGAHKLAERLAPSFATHYRADNQPLVEVKLAIAARRDDLQRARELAVFDYLDDVEKIDVGQIARKNLLRARRRSLRAVHIAQLARHRNPRVEPLCFEQPLVGALDVSGRYVKARKSEALLRRLLARAGFDQYLAQFFAQPDVARRVVNRAFQCLYSAI